MKLSSKSLLAAITLPVLMTACASNGDAVQITAQDLQHHNWQLTQIDGKDVVKSEHEQAPRLRSVNRMMASGMLTVITSLVRLNSKITNSALRKWA